MDINDMKVGDLFALQAALTGAKTDGGGDDSHWKIGENYLVRTVTHISTGRLAKVTDKELVLEHAAWIADTGRWSEQIVACEFKEVEPYPVNRQVVVGRGALIDAVIIDKLPAAKP